MVEDGKAIDKPGLELIVWSSFSFGLFWLSASHCCAGTSKLVNRDM